ncbi:hypothetical protein DAPPUDRAFT_251839 [Daphnia pulex]|uniref:EF-hand domain-containing protein n=1 Tax=Daphnia pulex TaxID=6669 RepID=E9H1G9_DAPPU|nr:hypothetical protein DAPPUDRAFT_251839 [Daphnia pulex]|eukprot:EFX74347.1 hypothetical protein DAPPUDRAFT_251839 [Daphnia pulex]
MAEEVADLRIRAQHLFAICDKEEKGFVTKRDMQQMLAAEVKTCYILGFTISVCVGRFHHGITRMQHEMMLEPEQLELVFDSLDADGNGYLTFDEFIQGFGKPPPP